MIALTNVGTADKIEVITAGAAVSVDYSVTQVDKLVADTSPSSVKTVPTVGNIATATTTKITTDPASSHEAMIREISLVNTHATTACTVQLQQTINAGTARKITAAYALAAGERVLINAEGTVFVYDAVGGVKTSLAAAMTVSVLTAGTGATYTPPVGCRAIWVRLWGGGGGSAGSLGTASAAQLTGGGGAGSYTEKLISPPAASYLYTIGAGGTAGAATPTAGGNGSDTTFGTSFLTAKGGNGSALGAAAGTTVASSNGGAGGLGGVQGGDLNSMVGQPGFPGIRLTATLGASGVGGSTNLGGAGTWLTAQGAGVAGAANSGSGAGGSFSNTATGQAGALGGTGVIIVDEYY